MPPPLFLPLAGEGRGSDGIAPGGGGHALNHGQPEIRAKVQDLSVPVGQPPALLVLPGRATPVEVRWVYLSNCRGRALRGFVCSIEGSAPRWICEGGGALAGCRRATGASGTTAMARRTNLRAYPPQSPARPPGNEKGLLNQPPGEATAQSTWGKAGVGCSTCRYHGLT